MQACDWQCYLRRYSDLQLAFGASNASAARSHWLSDGFVEHRDCTCSNGTLSLATAAHNLLACSTSHSLMLEKPHLLVR